MTRPVPTLAAILALSALSAFSALIALGLTGCGFLLADGGSSDTDNTVAVNSEVLNPAGGKAPAGLTVSLRRDDYLSPFPAFGKRAASAPQAAALTKRDVLTDSLGRFHIDSVDTGDYLIEVGQGDSLAALYRTSLALPRKTFALAPRTLEKNARVEGVVLFRAGTHRVFVQVYGLERMVPVDMATGRYAVSLPPGYFTLRYVDPERARAFAKTREAVLTPGQAFSMDTVVLGDSSEPFAAWRHSSEIVLNTTPGGIGIASDLRGFPLLVRLDPSNFDFAQALPGGADIRFSKSDGKSPLPFEIEDWDASARRASLWVRLDTAYGNRAAQSLYMYWGKSDAESASNGAAVFDTSDATAGVWHLGASGGNAPGAWSDATAHGNDGTGTSLAESSSVVGAIGGAARFAGRGQCIRIPDSPSLKLGEGSFTLSAWVQAEVLSRKHQVLAKRNPVTGDYEIQVLQNGRIAAYPGPAGSGALGFEAKGPVKAGTWHHLAFVRDGNAIALYLDGNLNATATTNVKSVASDSSLVLGQDGTGLEEGWIGILDEVRVHSRSLSADWLKLSHRTQAPGSMALYWRRFP